MQVNKNFEPRAASHKLFLFLYVNGIHLRVSEQSVQSLFRHIVTSSALNDRPDGPRTPLKMLPESQIQVDAINRRVHIYRAYFTLPRSPTHHDFPSALCLSFNPSKLALGQLTVVAFSPFLS